MKYNPNDRYRTIRKKDEVDALLMAIPAVDASHTYMKWAMEAKAAGYPLCAFCDEPLPRSEWAIDRCKTCRGVAEYQSG